MNLQPGSRTAFLNEVFPEAERVVNEATGLVCECRSGDTKEVAETRRPVVLRTLPETGKRRSGMITFDKTTSFYTWDEFSKAYPPVVLVDGSAEIKIEMQYQQIRAKGDNSFYSPTKPKITSIKADLNPKTLEALRRMTHHVDVLIIKGELWSAKNPAT